MDNRSEGIRRQKCVLLLPFHTLLVMTNVSDSSNCVHLANSVQFPHAIAVYEHWSRNLRELTIELNQEFVVLKDNNREMRYVQRLKDNAKGWVPSDCIVYKQNELRQEEWFADISRVAAEKRVLDKALCNGSFLVRRSETFPGFYVLSIRDDSTGQSKVRHFVINTSHRLCHLDKHKFPKPPETILERIRRWRRPENINFPLFEDIPSLVNYYKVNKGALCHVLTFPALLIPPRHIDIHYDTSIHWNVDMNDLTFIKRLGSGYFGKVDQKKWRGLVDVAVKTYNEQTMKAKEFEREAHMMIRCNHERIVKIFAISKEEPLNIIYEFMPGGDLLKYLQDKHKLNQIPSLEAFIKWARQIAEGMAYLEKNNIVHRDLATRNVLVEEEEDDSGIPNVKIGDLGLARRLNNGAYRLENDFKKHVNMMWNAPECKEKGFSNKTDQWKFGLTLHEMFTMGQRSSSTGSFETAIQLTYNTDPRERISRAELCPQKVYNEVILPCWNHNPEERPPFQWIYEFFTVYFIHN